MNLVFCLVSLLGAFLLFQVQPVISKFILPWFGGSPGVWTTCMLFFQVVLFGGYGYAHWLGKRRPRTQAIVHGMALLTAALLLPIAPETGWKPDGNQEPVGRILLLLAATVGFPYLVLSSTSPLVQVWFSRQYPQRSPWRLYSLSNIGSLTALLSYPVLIETRWDVMKQTQIWSAVFVAFALLMGICAVAQGMNGDAAFVADKANDDGSTKVDHAHPTWTRRAVWLLLPGFASMMLLATTNHVCQDVAVIPFLWVAPLSLYLISFIICFDHPRWYRRAWWAVPGMALVFFASGLFEVPGDWTPDFITELAVLLGAMFMVCMLCHGELARRRPGTTHLTEYYLMMSAGGALGGLMVSIVAPLVFTTFLEWSLGLLGGFLLAAWVAYRVLGPTASDRSGKANAQRVSWAVVVLVALGMMANWEFTFGSRLERVRDFYGSLAVEEYHDEDSGELMRSFICSGTKHGRQSLKPERRRDPLTYYGHNTGVGLVLDSLKTKPDAKVGVIGMGAGTVACYAEPGQTYRFYEINPNAVDLALRWFSFIADMKERGAHYELALGDARLQLEHEKSQQFDALLLDAFSGDSVPVHLLTREAFELFLTHLKPQGVIAVHITNHYLNLAPVVERVAREFGLSSTRIASEPDDNSTGHYATDYLVLSRDKAFIAAHPPVVPDHAWSVDVPLWTDHRHNLFQILQRQ